MIGPNLSEWSIRRPQLVLYFMLVAVIAGAADRVFPHRQQVGEA